MKIVVIPLIICCWAPRVLGAGINLSWDDCGTHGTTNKDYGCNNNVGVNTLVGSFVPPDGISTFLGLNAELQIQSTDTTLPDWWRHGSGECRGTTGLSASFDFTSGPFSCTDPFLGQAAGGYAYEIGYLLPNRARLIITCAIPLDNAEAL